MLQAVGQIRMITETLPTGVYNCTRITGFRNGIVRGARTRLNLAVSNCTRLGRVLFLKNFELSWESSAVKIAGNEMSVRGYILFYPFTDISYVCNNAELFGRTHEA